MSRNIKIKIFVGVLTAAAFALSLTVGGSAQTPRVKAAENARTATQQPRYTEYRGVRLGMIADEVRAKLGAPAIKGLDSDLWAFSEHETAQIAYDAERKVITISVDYLGGIGAPDYTAVIRGELERTANGSLYKLVRYESLGFWVSYNRATGTIPSVTVTIQKI